MNEGVVCMCEGREVGGGESVVTIRTLNSKLHDCGLRLIGPLVRNRCVDGEGGGGGWSGLDGVYCEREEGRDWGKWKKWRGEGGGGRGGLKKGSPFKT